MKSALPRPRAKSRAATSARARPARERVVRAPTEPGDFGRRAEPRPKRPVSPAYAVAFVVATLWTLALIAATAPLHQSGFALLLTALLAVGPTALLMGLAYLVRQGDNLAEASSGPDDQGVAMLGPALRAAAGAGHVAHGVQAQLVEATAAAVGARDDLETLQEAMSEGGSPNHIVTDLVGASRTSLARRLKTEGRDLAARSKALDEQLAQAAEVIEAHVRWTADAAAAAAVRFGAVDKSLEASAARLRPAAEQAAAVLRSAGRLADRQAEHLEAVGHDAVEKAKVLGRIVSDHGEGPLSAGESLRLARQGFLEAVRSQVEALRTRLARVGASAQELAAQAIAAGQSLGDASEPKEPGPEISAAAPASVGLHLDDEPAAAPLLEVATDASVARRPVRSVTPVDREARLPAAVVVARGIGGQITFDGTRVVIDRTQSASFVMHGAGGQRSILLGEVVSIRLKPPRRGAHGYLQFVLSRGRGGRGGPADVNSILFDASQQASFQQMAQVLRRAMRHLRRHPEATDPRAPGELAYLMDLRGRGLIDAREFADATARLSTAKRERRTWFRRNTRR